ncbi:MAG: hypothetical protein GY796_17310 [Chloroflexi bacterium]|nr:hypothetical protein [Chloroflexota bacterium]
MSVPLRINCSDFSKIPNVDELKPLVTGEHHLVLQFPRSFAAFDPDSIIKELAAQLPEFSVFYSGTTSDMNNITIKKVIDKQVVLENADLFLNALENFLNLADALITQLARKLNYSPEGVSVDWILDVEKTSGRLDNDWEYMFHGRECRFRNLATGQIVDARLRDFRNELAIPDPYFFAQYVRTTETESPISNLIKDGFHDMSRVIDILVENGFLKSGN